MNPFTRRALLTAGAAAAALPAAIPGLAAAMSADDPIARVGGYFLSRYGMPDGPVQSANLMSALGAVSGFFAQLKARAMIQSGAWKMRDGFLVEVTVTDGSHYYFGDAISAGLFGSTTEGMGLWSYIGAAAGDPQIASKIDVVDMVKNAASTVGGPKFGIPRVAPAYRPSELPIAALKRHVQVMVGEMARLKVPAEKYSEVFGSAAQLTVPWAAGQRSAKVDLAMPPIESVRLFLEAAVPMSKVDPKSVGIAV